MRPITSGSSSWVTFPWCSLSRYMSKVWRRPHKAHFRNLHNVTIWTRRRWKRTILTTICTDFTGTSSIYCAMMSYAHSTFFDHARFHWIACLIWSNQLHEMGPSNIHIVSMSSQSTTRSWSCRMQTSRADIAAMACKISRVWFSLHAIARISSIMHQVSVSREDTEATYNMHHALQHTTCLQGMSLPTNLPKHRPNLSRSPGESSIHILLEIMNKFASSSSTAWFNQHMHLNNTFILLASINYPDFFLKWKSWLIAL